MQESHSHTVKTFYYIAIKESHKPEILYEVNGVLCILRWLTSCMSCLLNACTNVFQLSKKYSETVKIPLIVNVR